MAEVPAKYGEKKLPKRKAEVLMKEIGRETILYSDTDEALHVLNSTAKLIWMDCDGEHSFAEVEGEIREHFTVPAERDVMADILNTIEIFTSKGLLEDIG